MPEFEQEWISPILEIYKKEKLTENFIIILGLNPLGQALCRQLYEERHYETVLVFNSPNFSTWNRYPVSVKPPVVPVQGMVNDDLMLIFGDIFIKDYEWVTDMIFYLRGNVPTRFLIAFMVHDNLTCGHTNSRKGSRLLQRMDIPPGNPDYYDGLIAPLISIGPVADLDPVAVFLEESHDGEVVLQVDEISVTVDEIERCRDLLNKGLDLRLTS